MRGFNVILTEEKMRLGWSEVVVWIRDTHGYIFEIEGFREGIDVPGVLGYSTLRTGPTGHTCFIGTS